MSVAFALGWLSVISRLYPKDLGRRKRPALYATIGTMHLLLPVGFWGAEVVWPTIDGDPSIGRLLMLVFWPLMVYWAYEIRQCFIHVYKSLTTHGEYLW